MFNRLGFLDKRHFSRLDLLIALKCQSAIFVRKPTDIFRED